MIDDSFKEGAEEELAMLKKMVTNKYSHNEAFCVMKYRCEECGIEEYLWNSRDGVTPFIISCHACMLNEKEGSMAHVDWNLDKRIVDYRPPKGSRIFIDLTKDMARKYKALQIVHWWDMAKFPMSERYGSPKEAFDALMEEWKPDGTPDVIVVPF